MKKPFFARYALLILMAVFFLAPFALRGARLAVQNMKNDVKDWLPSDFAETTELDWFREHFLGEQFVVVSWEGCKGNEESFKTFVDKFFPEVPPSIQRAREEAAATGTPVPAELGNPDRWPFEVRRQEFTDSTLNLYVRQLQVGDLPPDEDFVGNQYGLSYVGQDLDNWGGLQEKWLQGDGDRWYYLLPDGDLYRWSGSSTPLQPLINLYHRGTGQGVVGEYVKSLGPVDGPWYYDDPRRLNARLFKTVTTGPGVLHDLTKPGGSLEGDPQRAKQRLTGALFGPDGEQTSLIVTLTDAGRRDLRRAIGRGILGKPRGALLHIASESGIHPPPKPMMAPPPFSWFAAAPAVPNPPIIKLGGPPVDNVAIDEEGQITLVRLVGLSLLVGLGLSLICFRSVYATIMVFFVGGLSAVASLSFVFWSGESVDAVLMSMPSLVYVLGLSGAVHIVNYYSESVSEVGLRRAAGRSIELGWKPCTLAAFTTSLGLLSLYASNILPIRKFGLFSAIGVMATLILLFTYLPAALQIWPPRRFRERATDGSHATSIERVIEKFWVTVGGFMVRFNIPVAIICFLSMLGIGYGLTKIDTDVQLLKMFDGDATIISDYKWLERNLGKLVPMEVVVKVDPRAMRGANKDGAPLSNDAQLRLSFLERMELTTYVQSVLDRRLGAGGDQKIGRAMLAATFAPSLPGPGGSTRDVAFRGGFSGRLEASRDKFLASDYLRIDKQDDSELWRISLRLGALSDVDYGEFVNDLKDTIEPVLAAYRFREQILSELLEKQGDEGIRAASVYLVGAPLGPSRGASRKREVPSPSGGKEAAGQPQTTTISQSDVFGKVLATLLKNSGLTLRWHDPRFELPSNWEQTLTQQDCVVWVDTEGNYDGNMLADNATMLIDARDHRFDPERGTANECGEAISAIYTGVVPVVYKAQRTLLVSLIESTGWAFGMIAVVMIFVVRSLRAGLLSMLPNVFPVVAVFGVMGWRGTAVDIGSMMTASVAMGVAVDDTIHFLTWFRRGLDQGLARKSAIMLAYRRVGLAMTQTTAIGGLGLSIFAFSTFTPTQRFGTLMLALLAAALIGDLIFLPALLASPLGRVFSKKRSKTEPPTKVLPDVAHDSKRPHVVPQPQTMQNRSSRDSA